MTGQWQVSTCSCQANCFMFVYCADLLHQKVLQEHLYPEDVLRPLKAGGNKDCREDQTLSTLSSHVIFMPCKQGPQMFSPYLSQSFTSHFCIPSTKAALISIRSFLPLSCELVLLFCSSVLLPSLAPVPHAVQTLCQLKM